MKRTQNFVTLLLPFLALAVFILSTDPYSLPLSLLLVPFLLIGVGCFRATREFLRMTPISRRKGSLIAGVLASIILLSVVLQSIKQLYIKDFLILVAFLVGMTLYMRRIDV